MGKDKSQLLQVWRGFRSSRMFPNRKIYEVIPMIVCVAAVLVDGVATITHSMFKMDVAVNKYAPPRHESMDLMHPKQTKLIVFNQKYDPMPELHHILQDIKEEEIKQDKVDVEDDGVTRRRV